MRARARARVLVCVCVGARARAGCMLYLCMSACVWVGARARAWVSWLVSGCQPHRGFGELVGSWVRAHACVCPLWVRVRVCARAPVRACMRLLRACACAALVFVRACVGAG